MELEDASAARPGLLSRRQGNCPIYVGTATEYFPVGEACFRRMLEDMEQAKEYIYLEYFIIQRGKMWGAILKLLREKIRQGVDIRVIYDDFGCITKLPSGYFKKLRAMGIHCRVFNPFVPIMSPLLNNRDHRKFLIVDGRVGYTGGINLADEYINETHPYGHWKDCGSAWRGGGVVDDHHVPRHVESDPQGPERRDAARPRWN